MNSKKQLKENIHVQLSGILDQRIASLEQEIASAKEARDDETKSSVGDKHETGRAMAHIELDRLEGQLLVVTMLKKDLDQIDPAKSRTKVEPGSLVLTNQGNYYISVGLGKVEMNNEDYYAISLLSPLGQVLGDKEGGDKVRFQDKDFKITHIS